MRCEVGTEAVVREIRGGFLGGPVLVEIHGVKLGKEIETPLLIAGRLILSLMDYFHLANVINLLLSPLVGFTLGLPKEVGVTLVFGILRKALALVMLIQALGTHEFSSVMSHTQMMVFTVFSMFYVPCLATIGVLRAVLGNRGMVTVLVLTTGIGVALALAARILILPICAVIHGYCGCLFFRH